MAGADITAKVVAIPHQNFLLLPILHGRLECAALVRLAFEVQKPDAIAVELPTTLKAAVLKAVARLPLLSVVHYQDEYGQTVYWPIEPTDALVEAIRLGVTGGVPVYFIDRDMENYPRIREAFPDSYALQPNWFASLCRSISPDFCGREAPGARPAAGTGYGLSLAAFRKTVPRLLVVFGLAHYPGLLRQLSLPQAQPLAKIRRPGVQVAHLAEDSSREILTEIPYLSAAYESWRQEIPLRQLDRLDLLGRLVSEAAARYHKSTGETISVRQQAILHQFGRNYALVHSQLTPDFYQLVVAARGVADDDFAYEAWDLGATYPWQEAHPNLPVLRLTGEDLFLNQRKIHFRRRLRQTRRRLVPMPVRKKPKEKRPGEWRKKWQGKGICSFPPEDLVVEGFGDFVRKRAVNMLSEQNRRVVPFVASLLDGIDVRETIRRWPENVLYVMEEKRAPGKIGAVVVVFDPDEGEEEKFPWRLTWLGEHSQESDMAFYANQAGENLVGPGISRCQYGGFMLSYPPWRLYDIWQDFFLCGSPKQSGEIGSGCPGLLSGKKYYLCGGQTAAVTLGELGATGWGKNLFICPSAPFPR